MTLRLLGAGLVLLGCGGFGFSMAGAYRARERGLRQLIRALEYMECELQYLQPPLPQLCTATARILSGELKRVFQEMQAQMDQGNWVDAQACMEAVLSHHPALSPVLGQELLQLGQTLGQFDLTGQLSALRSLHQQCTQEQQRLAQEREGRLRSYETLGLCTGAALAVLLL